MSPRILFSLLRSRVFQAMCWKNLIDESPRRPRRQKRITLQFKTTYNREDKIEKEGTRSFVLFVLILVLILFTMCVYFIVFVYKYRQIPEKIYSDIVDNLCTNWYHTVIQGGNWSLASCPLLCRQSIRIQNQFSIPRLYFVFLYLSFLPFAHK